MTSTLHYHYPPLHISLFHHGKYCAPLPISLVLSFSSVQIGQRVETTSCGFTLEKLPPPHQLSQLTSMLCRYDMRVPAREQPIHPDIDYVFLAPFMSCAKCSCKAHAGLACLVHRRSCRWT